MQKGKIVKASGVDWQSDFPTARDQFISTVQHLKKIQESATKDLRTIRTTMLMEAQRQAKSTLHTCASWPAIYSCVGKIVDQVYDKECGDRLKLALFGWVKTQMGLANCKEVRPQDIATMKRYITEYLQENL